MTLLTLHSVGKYVAFDEEECRNVGRSLSREFQAASPFPHIVLDDFLDSEILKSVDNEFPARKSKEFFNRDQERLKFQFHPDEAKSGLIRNVMAELNSSAFLGFLEEMTGISGLVSDPFFEGGGLHETLPGGHLGIHADFNIHKKVRLERKLNLLIYLNDDWSPAYGGDLELWDEQMKACKVRVAPVLGRAVVFDTSLDSFHGHPEPLTCPPDRSRRSIATYYYAAYADGLLAVPERTTNFQARPGTVDKTDWRIRMYHFARDWAPPKLMRMASKIRGSRRREG